MHDELLEGKSLPLLGFLLLGFLLPAATRSHAVHSRLLVLLEKCAQHFRYAQPTSVLASLDRSAVRELLLAKSWGELGGFLAARSAEERELEEVAMAARDEEARAKAAHPSRSSTPDWRLRSPTASAERTLPAECPWGRARDPPPS